MPRPYRDLAIDALILLAAAAAAAVSARAEGLAVGAGWLLAFVAVTLALLGYLHLYRPRFAPRLLDDVGAIVAATAVAAMAVTFARVLFTDDPEAAQQAVRAWLFSAVYLCAGRGGRAWVDVRHRRAGRDLEPTAIVGAGEVGRSVAHRLATRPEYGLRPAVFFDPDPPTALGDPALPVAGGSLGASFEPHAAADELERAMRAHGVTRVIFTFSRSSHTVELALIRRCQDLDVSVSLVPRLFEGLPDQTEFERVGGLPLVSVHPRDPRGWQFAVKYAFDRVAAGLALVLLSPLLLAIAIGVRATTGTPVLFRQERVGMDGHRFEMLKFRTMRGAEVRLPAPEGADLAPGGVEGEDRRTRFGAFLRRTSFDELPQLVNVVRGDMSLVGPRPERPEYVHIFDRSVYRYVDRSRVKSGITGWAQVHGLRGKTSLADRVEWDNYYIENWSPWLDLKVLVRTVGVLFRGRGE
jgi:exopolysaccharide biosynthesis polyprenyl glycosylphosphotransferase